MANRIQVVEYDPRWPALFEREASRIRQALGDRALRIEHTGSTSVPGLAAKPVIDIVLVVGNSADEDAYRAALEECGILAASSKKRSGMSIACLKVRKGKRTCMYSPMGVRRCNAC